MLQSQALASILTGEALVHKPERDCNSLTEFSRYTGNLEGMGISNNNSIDFLNVPYEKWHQS